MKVTIDLNDHKSEEGTWKETTAKAVEHLTGKTFTDVVSEAQENEKPEIPDGRPTSWRRSEKLSFIEQYGRSEYEKLIRERK